MGPGLACHGVGGGGGWPQQVPVELERRVWGGSVAWEGCGDVSYRMGALSSERWVLAEVEGPGGQCCFWCGREHGGKAQG